MSTNSTCITTPNGSITGLHPGLTPSEAWDATAVATPPTPPPPSDETTPYLPPSPGEKQSTQRLAGLKGIVRFQRTRYLLGKHFTGQTIHIMHSNATIAFYDSDGTEIIAHDRPPAGTEYGRSGPASRTDVGKSPIERASTSIIHGMLGSSM